MIPEMPCNFILGLLLALGISTITIANSRMYPDAQIQFVKKQIELKKELFFQAYLQLLDYADAALSRPNNALTDFTVPGFYVNPVGHRNNSRSLQSDSFCMDIPNIDETYARLLTRFNDFSSYEFSMNQ